MKIRALYLTSFLAAGLFFDPASMFAGVSVSGRFGGYGGGFKGGFSYSGGNFRGYGSIGGYKGGYYGKPGGYRGGYYGGYGKYGRYHRPCRRFYPVYYPYYVGPTYVSLDYGYDSIAPVSYLPDQYRPQPTNQQQVTENNNAPHQIIINSEQTIIYNNAPDTSPPAEGSSNHEISTQDKTIVVNENGTTREITTAPSQTVTTNSPNVGSQANTQVQPIQYRYRPFR